VGVLSDGDVRRSLLEDTLMVSPVWKVMNTDPVTADTASKAEALLKHMALVGVPVVDDAGTIREVVVENRDHVLTLKNPAVLDTGNVAHGAVAVIPARGGSKRIPRKNLATVGGRSLLAWAIRAARSSRYVSNVLVSTDDQAVAEECQRLGVPVPWMRPVEFSRDDSPTIDALAHAIEWASANYQPAPEFGLLLEPTAPLRRADHIDDAITLLADTGVDCVMTVTEVPHLYNPEELLRIEDGLLRPFLPDRTMDNRRLRGAQRPVYIPNGLVYAFRVSSLLAHHSLYGKTVLPMITPWSEFLDIDTEDDLKAAEMRLERMQQR
jgi:CMP-N,N'-diacetyllegionaminic acid synthase